MKEGSDPEKLGLQTSSHGSESCKGAGQVGSGTLSCELGMRSSRLAVPQAPGEAKTSLLDQWETPTKIVQGHQTGNHKN